MRFPRRRKSPYRHRVRDHKRLGGYVMDYLEERKEDNCLFPPLRRGETTENQEAFQGE